MTPLCLQRPATVRAWPAYNDPMDSYDVFVRGSGCVGRSLALALGAKGLRVALLGSMVGV